MDEEGASSNQRASQEDSWRHFQAVFNDPHVLMGILAPDGTVRRVNETALSLTDADESEVTGVPFWETPWWSHSPDLQANLQQWIEQAAAGEYVDFEVDHYTPTGERRHIAGLLRPVRRDGEIVSLIVSGRDVTGQTQQQQRLQVLYRIIRHDLRNGLNIIEGYATELADRLAATDAPDAFETMAQTVATEAADLAAAATKAQRFEQLTTDDTSKTIPVDTLFARLVAATRERAPRATIDATPPTVDVAVPRSIRLAVEEAVDNALEHHDGQAPAIELTASVATEEEPPCVRLEITDDGPGIPQSEVEPVMAGEETPLAHTSGVGLWLIKWIAERHGGDFSATAIAPRGSRVTLTLPLTQPSTEPYSGEQ